MRGRRLQSNAARSGDPHASAKVVYDSDRCPESGRVVELLAPVRRRTRVDRRHSDTVAGWRSRDVSPGSGTGHLD